MRFGRLVIRSLRHYRRTHAAALLTAMVCTAILTGALLVGDSVQAGLEHLAALRLGRIDYTLLAGEYPFQSDLAVRISHRTRFDTAAVLMTDGALERPDGTLRINGVRILGVDDAFFGLSQSASATPVQLPAVNDALRQRLGEGSTDLILRLDDPSALSRDLIFSSDDRSSTTLRIGIEGVVADEAMGRFGLQADQQAPLNLFVSRRWLAEQLELEERANLLLVAATASCPSSVDQLNRALAGVVEPEDFGLQWIELPEVGMLELQSRQLFIPDHLGQAALASGHNPTGIFAYFVNGFSHGDQTTPYSIVAGIGDPDPQGLFYTLGADEMVINEWLADDLNVEPGQEVTIDYFAISPTHTLIEKQHTFGVRQVVPMLGFADDASLMPPFPGLADAQTCLEWDPAIPVDLNRIRDKDERYWDDYRGTPKAFISLEAAQQLWENRFGNLTAIRWPMADNHSESLREQLTASLDPSAFGVFFADAAEHSRRAGAGSTDFGGLFAGLSAFLILACVVLLALIFVFTLQQRSGQAGILLAMGWSKGAISRLLLAEGALLALVGALIGTVLGVVYTLGMMVALRTVWQDAVAGAMLRFYANPTTLLIGAATGFLIAVGAMGVGLRGHLKRNPIELLSYTPMLVSGTFSAAGRIIRLSVLAGCGVVFVGSFFLLDTLLSQELFFFLNGTVLLLIFVLCAAEMMRAAARSRTAPSSPARLVVKNMIRRPGRSLAVLLTVACGVFMVLGVGLNRKSPSRYTERDSGTGGFALWVETAMPLAQAPDEAWGRQVAQQAGLSNDMALISMRRRRGDDASCLNLHRAQNPTLLGVRPRDFAKREAFSFRSAEPWEDSPWSLLTRNPDDATIPAIGDYATVYWGLGLDLGDTLSIQDDRGQPLNLKIVGILKESVFQGRLLISERDFIERFASDSGYSVFLVDAEHAQADGLVAALSRRLADYGAEVVPTEVILRNFLRVENTYLTIFLALGGLGLVLGSAGAGLVLLFNVMDRRGELAMMQAMGFSRVAIGRLLLAEHVGLFAAGVLIGGVSASIAVLPGAMAAGGGTLATGLLLTAIILLSGFVWVALGRRAAMKQHLLDNLRSE